MTSSDITVLCPILLAKSDNMVGQELWDTLYKGVNLLFFTFFFHPFNFVFIFFFCLQFMLPKWQTYILTGTTVLCPVIKAKFASLLLFFFWGGGCEKNNFLFLPTCLCMKNHSKPCHLGIGGAGVRHTHREHSHQLRYLHH